MQLARARAFVCASSRISTALCILHIRLTGWLAKLAHGIKMNRCIEKCVLIVLIEACFLQSHSFYEVVLLLVCYKVQGIIPWIVVAREGKKIQHDDSQLQYEVKTKFAAGTKRHIKIQRLKRASIRFMHNKTTSMHWTSKDMYVVCKNRK